MSEVSRSESGLEPDELLSTSANGRVRTISGSVSSTSTSIPNPSTPPNLDEGYLDVSARWGGEHETRSNAVRSSRMIGNRVGVSPPPPPGPPPSDPPPLPPAPSSHPFATSSRPRPSARLSSLSSLRKSGMISSRPSSPGPSGPPPSNDLPPLPTTLTQNTPPKDKEKDKDRDPSRPNHVRQSSQSNTPPTISPRASSLFNQPGPSGTKHDSLGTPITLNKKLPEHVQPQPTNSATAGPSSKPPRTPSRHLLQTALDLAQKAVEMDKNNDVLGALAAYREAVSRLKAVMERVGVEPAGDKKSGKKGKSEEEGRTLRGIHDAYVARIQLLSSYETNPEADTPASAEAGPSKPRHISQPSTSTSTLVPHSTSSTEGTPRPSLDDGGMTGIGNFMLADSGDQSFDASALSPARPKAAVSAIKAQPPAIPQDTPPPTMEQRSQSTDIPTSLNQQNLNGQAIAAPSVSQQKGSIPSIGLGYPTSPPSNTPHTSTPMKSHISSSSISGDTEGSPSSSKSRLKRPNRPSMGLDMEADLTGIDGVADEKVEMLARTPRESHMPSSLGSSNDRRSSNQSNRRVIPDSPQSVKSDIERPLPPLPNSASSQNGQPRKSSLTGSSKPLPTPQGVLLVSPTTTQGTISQRRQSRPLSGTISTLLDQPQQTAAFPVSSSNSSVRSGPGGSSIPPVPTNQLRHKSSFSSSSQLGIGMVPPQISRQPSGSAENQGLRIETHHSPSPAGAGGRLAPPVNITNRAGISPRSLPPLPDTALTATSGGTLISPLPETQPSEVLHRPFHLLRVLHSSMDPEGSGSYLTGSIHISSSIWNLSQNGRNTIGPPKIAAQEVKMRCLESLILHFESIRITGQGLLNGPRRHSRPGGSGGGANNSKLAEEFCLTLDELDEEMDNTYKLLSKGGVMLGLASGGWKGKKHGGTTKSWGSRISRSMDKMTNSRSTTDKSGMEGTDKYVDLLANLCIGAQVINEHLLNFTSPSRGQMECTAAYASLPEQSYRNIESRLKRTSEFVGSIIVPFVLDDFKQFLLRYLKGGVKYLED
uniref:MIT domain-containing protein n=1 Tax=Kwoniella bestiolae CBS 10118 TaxID=1296100 RepID=A0A1B9G7B7_9TREE|nr:hypothetical protein I302_04581 [Kwoniella bestiolae CBS 10118]OCF26891.1 hypothetical protein I302_04581 [Kwoniella bestiolae CBS 10118]